MEGKLFSVVQTIYKYIALSFLYWVQLIKGAVIYGVVPASGALLKTFESMQNSEVEIDISKEVPNQFKKYRNQLFPSFLFSFSTICLLSTLYFVVKSQFDNSLLFAVVILYTLALVVILLAYYSYYVAIIGAGRKDAFIYGYVAMFRNIGASLAILLGTLLLFGIAWWNLFLFLVAAPSAFFGFVYFLLTKKIPGPEKAIKSV